MIVYSLNFHRKTFPLIIGLFILVALITPRSSLGQAVPSTILLTWQARNYVPPAYAGKALPSPSTFVTASAEVVDQGKVADLSRNSIYWYLDGRLISSGVGKKTATIRVPHRASQYTELMVQIPGYKGELLFKRIPLLVSSPVAAIEAPYAGRSFGSRAVTVHGMPYFFNVSDMSTLIFSWTVNGQAAPAATSTAEKTQLTVNINPDASPGAALDIGLTIQDPKQQLYYGSKNTTLRLSK